MRIRDAVAVVVLLLLGVLVWWLFRGDEPERRIVASQQPPPSRAQKQKHELAPRIRTGAPAEAAGHRTPPGASPQHVAPAGADPGPADAEPLPAAAESKALVRGTVWSGVGRVRLEGCGTKSRWLRDGDVFEIEVPAGSCELSAFRRDGVFHVRAAPIHLDVEGGDLLSGLVFDFPAERFGGLGMQVEPVDGGIGVMGVVDGMGAIEAGVTRDDVVLEIDGLSTEDMSLDEFIEVALGPEGTEAMLLLEAADGSVRTVTIDRRLLDEL